MTEFKLARGEAGGRRIVRFASIFQTKVSLGRNKFNGQIAWIPVQLFWELQQPGPRDILSCEYTRYWCRCTPSAFSTSLQRKVVFYQLPTLREIMEQLSVFEDMDVSVRGSAGAACPSVGRQRHPGRQSAQCS